MGLFYSGVRGLECAYVRRSHTAKVAENKAAFALRDHRKAECARLDIDLKEYMHRLSEWQILRALMESRRDAIRARQDKDAFALMVKNHDKKKISRAAAAQAKTVLDELGSKTPYPDRQEREKLAQNFGRVFPPTT